MEVFNYRELRTITNVCGTVPGKIEPGAIKFICLKWDVGISGILLFDYIHLVPKKKIKLLSLSTDKYMLIIKV